MRKFGFDSSGVCIGTSPAFAQAKRDCLKAGLHFVVDQRTGAAIGHLVACLEELEAKVAALQAQLDSKKREAEAKEPLVDVNLPEHLRTPYRQMNGEQRQQLKAWKAQHAA